MSDEKLLDSEMFCPECRKEDRYVELALDEARWSVLDYRKRKYCKVCGKKYDIFRDDEV
jgi:hypothetical protein